MHFASAQFHANLDAPAWERSARSCPGAGSSANRYACVTFMTGPDHDDSLHGSNNIQNTSFAGSLK
jgi:hypothetical protein